MPEMNLITPLLAYEIEMAANLCADAFKAFKAADKHWFALAPSLAHFAMQTDTSRLLVEDGYDANPTAYTAILRLYAKYLRNAGLYVAPRMWIGDKHHTSVWLSDKDKTAHFRVRATIDHGSPANGGRAQYDYSKKWSFGDE
jgi:hypothetical protein